MKGFGYVLSNFFTHKDYLVAAEFIPGTLFTPLQFVFEAVLLAIIIWGAIFLSKNKQYIKPVYIVLWILLIVWEFVMMWFDNATGKIKAFDFVEGLSLYPCSIIMYTLPFIIWGKGLIKRIAYGYVCTLGLLGALVNFLFPISRLTTYSCISLPGMHTFFFHGSILFVFLVTMLSGEHNYRKVYHWWDLLIPSVASLVVSIPANIINYSPINADYMYFKGRFFVLAKIFNGLPEVAITFILYGLYIIIPALFYLPSYIKHNKYIRSFVKYNVRAISSIFGRKAS